MNRLLDALHSGRVILMDGPMGTELQRLGLRDGECSALWNLTHPEKVAAVHAAYLEAGAEVLLTNTFLANHQALSQYHLQARLGDIWKAALENARIFPNPEPIVLADSTRLGGSETPPDREQCRTLVDLARSADGFLLETLPAERAVPPGFLAYMLALEEQRMPFLASYTFGQSGNLALERSLCANFVRGLGRAPVAAVGANCGKEIGMDDLLEIVHVLRWQTDRPLFIRPNAGTPRRTAAGWEYPRTPQEMADKLWPLLEAGVTMVGGCCGTTPAHIAAFRQVVDEWNRRNIDQARERT